MPYRKALITEMMLHQILALSDTTSVSFSDLMTTVASYFDFNTESATKEVETVVARVRTDLFCVNNLQDISFSNAPGNRMTVPDSAQRPADFTYFTFRSVVSANSVDNFAPIKTLSLELSLYLPHTIVNPFYAFTISSTTKMTSSLATILPKLVRDFSLKLGNFSDRIYLRLERMK